MRIVYADFWASSSDIFDLKFFILEPDLGPQQSTHVNKILGVNGIESSSDRL